MRKIVAKTDVLAHGNRFPKGTGFVVSDHPDPKSQPPQIDPTTAQSWKRLDWAEDEAEKGKSDAR